MPSPPTRGCGLKHGKQFALVAAAVSPPTRGCGLKHNFVNRNIVAYTVTPYAGVWIETTLCLTVYFGVMSPPTRGCGLKLQTTPLLLQLVTSPPTRGCGLKLQILGN